MPYNLLPTIRQCLYVFPVKYCCAARVLFNEYYMLRGTLPRKDEIECITLRLVVYIGLEVSCMAQETICDGSLYVKLLNVAPMFSSLQRDKHTINTSLAVSIYSHSG